MEQLCNDESESNLYLKHAFLAHIKMFPAYSINFASIKKHSSLKLGIGRFFCGTKNSLLSKIFWGGKNSANFNFELKKPNSNFFLFTDIEEILQEINWCHINPKGKQLNIWMKINKQELTFWKRLNSSSSVGSR